MAFDDLEAELALLINQMETQPEIPHELLSAASCEKLNEFKRLRPAAARGSGASREGARRVVRRDQARLEGLGQERHPAKAGVQFLRFALSARARFQLAPE